MRPGQNKRMRGRPTNGRRGPNPLTRSYESNGPDVKIRGNAQHVAEKYLQLARDAHTGGDPVAAENYLQHAEHYFRLIAAAQAAQAMAQSGQARPMGEGDGDDLEDDDDYSALSDRFASPSERAAATFQPPQAAFQGQPGAPNAPQPFVERPPFDADRQGQNDRGGFQPRQDRQGNRFPDRGPRQDRPVPRPRRRISRQPAEPRRPRRASSGPIATPGRRSRRARLRRQKRLAQRRSAFVHHRPGQADRRRVGRAAPAGRGGLRPRTLEENEASRQTSERRRRRRPISAARPQTPAALALRLQRRANGSGLPEAGCEPDERRIAGQRIARRRCALRQCAVGFVPWGRRSTVGTSFCAATDGRQPCSDVFPRGASA